MPNPSIKLVFSATEIQLGIRQLAIKLNQKFAHHTVQPVILIGILKGCLPFFLELIKHLKFEIVIDFMIVKSYFGEISSEIPQLILDTNIDLKDQTVLIIEDIVETGRTVKLAIEKIQLKKPQLIEVVSLLHKLVSNQILIPNYYIFQLKSHDFLVGFGLDYHERKRNLPYIGALTDYESKTSN